MKKNFKGEFNLNGQMFTIFRHAKCQEDAKQLMLIELSKEAEVSRFKLNTQIFNGQKDNYRITKV